MHTYAIVYVRTSGKKPKEWSGQTRHVPKTLRFYHRRSKIPDVPYSVPTPLNLLWLM